MTDFKTYCPDCKETIEPLEFRYAKDGLMSYLCKKCKMKIHLELLSKKEFKKALKEVKQ